MEAVWVVYICTRSTPRLYYGITGEVDKSEAKRDKSGRPIWRSPLWKEKGSMRNDNNEAGDVSSSSAYRKHSPKVKKYEGRGMVNMWE